MADSLISKGLLDIIFKPPAENPRSPGERPFPDIQAYFHGHQSGPDCWTWPALVGVFEPSSGEPSAVVFQQMGQSWLREGKDGRRSTRRRTLIHIGPWLQPCHVVGLHGVDLKPGSADQVVHLAIEVTAPANPLPARRQPMLPTSYRALL